MSNPKPLELMEPDLSMAARLSFESVARRCARGVRGCATDEQYKELIERIIEALAFASGNIKPMDRTLTEPTSPAAQPVPETK